MLYSFLMASIILGADPKEQLAQETELFKLWREIAVAEAEAAVASSPKDKDSKLRLATAKKFPIRPGQLSAAVGSVGRAPEALWLVQAVDDKQFVSRLGIKDVMIKGLPAPASEESLTFTGLLRVSGTTAVDIQRSPKGRAPFIEKQQLLVVEPIDLKAELEAAKKKAADLSKPKP